jgi:DNA-binding transcriptional LysR family regulator
MSGIHAMNVGGIDLNLLKVLAALLEERSVTAAGRRIGLSQPATSNALRRLRDLIGDPLLVRGPNGGLELTPHAETLLEPVQRAVAAVADAFRPPVEFNSQRAQLTVRLAATDIAALAVLPDLLCALAREAPGIDLVVRTADHDQVNAWLQSGEVALALGVFWAPPPNALKRPLLMEEFVLLVRPGHPLQEGELTPERLAAFPAILVAPGGSPRGIADAALAALDLRRRVAVAVPHFLLAPHLVRDSDLTVVFPRSLAVAAGAPLGLTILPLPLDIGPFMVEMMWLTRTDADPALAWLRARIAEVAERRGAGNRWRT